MTSSNSEQKNVPSAENETSQHIENQLNKVTKIMSDTIDNQKEISDRPTDQSFGAAVVVPPFGTVNPNPAPTPPALEIPPRPTSPDVLKPGLSGNRGPQIDPSAARRIIESRPEPSNIYVPPVLKSLLSSNASNTVQGPASVSELARALDNDPQLIYEFVANNIEFTQTYGLQKGGYGALVDGFGNSFDQSDLMVQLLTLSGITAKYVLGQVRLYEADWMAWLGTNTNPYSAANLLSNGGIPNTVTWDGVNFLYYIDVSHMWVKATIGGTDYLFDPSRKIYTTVSGINLATASGYSQSTFLANAASGATITADYAQNFNRGNIRSNLQTYSMNLVNWIKTNLPAARLDDILGGRTINAVSIPLLQTTLSYETPGDVPTVYTTLPSQYKTTFRVQYDWNGSGYNIDQTFFSNDICGQRLSLFFNVSGQAELALNGTVLATSSVQGIGTYNSVLLTAVHPYGSTFADQSVWHTIYRNGSYIIANAWGMAGDGMIDVHIRQMSLNKLAGNAADSEAVLGEVLEVYWHSWDAEKCRTADLLGRLSTSMTVFHHQVGVVTADDIGAVAVDLGMINWNGSALDNNYDHVNTCRTALAMHGIAYEQSVMPERVGLPGVSSTAVVDLAVQAGQKIYSAKSANWLTNVKPNLTGYQPADLTNIENWYVNNGWNVIVPESGSITKEDWTGFGYLAVPISPYSGTVGIISGTLKGAVLAKKKIPPKITLEGGISNIADIPLIKQEPKLDKSDSGGLKGVVSGSNLQGGTSGGGTSGGAQEGGGPGGDPIDPWSGSFIYQNTDISVGSLPAPYSLAFARSYSSTSRLTDGPLGLGWIHNYQLTASVRQDVMRSLGKYSPIDAVAAIVEMFVSVDLLTDLTRPLNKYLTCALANQWFVDQLSGNVVAISNLGYLSFVKLPDGSYNPPPKSAASLALSAGAYTYTAVNGDKMIFNTDGTLSQIVFPQGVTVSLTYSSGLLSTVSNGLGRTLTLSYTSGRLISVSDGNGRSVSYAVNASGNLTSFTNTLAKVTTYGYDIPGRMTQVFLPQNPATAVVTNVYDVLDRVKTQQNALNQIFSVYCAGSRTKFVDAAGSYRTIYWNNFGLALKTIDALNNAMTCQYDGLYRLTSAVTPEGNKSTFTYDAKNNPLTMTQVPKPGSPLSNLVWTMTNDPIWNKLKTVSNPLGQVTTFNYDPVTGSLLSVQSPIIGGQTPTVTYTYNSRGQILTQTDQTGKITSFTYDGTTEKLTQIVSDVGVSPHLNLTSSFGYDSVGNVTSITDARSNQTTLLYDATRRLTKKTECAPFSYVTNVAYDDNGQLTSVQRQTGTTPAWQIYSLTYSLTGQRKTLTDPASKVTTWDYDSADRLQKVTDAQSRIWQYSYDALNRVYQVTDPTNTVSQTNGYSPNCLLTSVKDARNNVTSITYDGFDRLDKTIYADTTFDQNQSYDAAGNVLTHRTRSGNTVTATFDVLNRLATKTPQGQPTVTFVYDLIGRVTQVSKPVVAGDPSSGALVRSFDTAGRFTQEQYPDAKTVTHELDANGNRTKTTWPDGYFVTRTFDQLNRLTDIFLNGSGVSAAHFTYDQLSRRTGVSFSNGTSVAYTPQLNEDVTALSNTFVGSSVSFTLGYNDVHQVVSRAISDTTYEWHAANAAVITYGTADSVNKYPTVGGIGYSYDGNQNLTGDGTWTFAYDTENHLLTANKSGVSASYVYDPTHRQAEKTVGAVKTRFVYDGSNLVATYDGTSGLLQNRYVHGPGADEVLIQITAAGVVSFCHRDDQNSVVAISDASGAVTNAYKYSPFGESAPLSGTLFGYTGQRFDAETGLYYYKARYYSTVIGRFLQPDPIGYGGGSLNLYEYVNNDPMNLRDPSGLVPVPQDPIPGGSSGGIGGGLPGIPQLDSLPGTTIPGGANKTVLAGTAIGFGSKWAPLAPLTPIAETVPIVLVGGAVATILVAGLNDIPRAAGAIGAATVPLTIPDYGEIVVIRAKDGIRVHGNSLSYNDYSYVYELLNSDGTTYKYGIGIVVGDRFYRSDYQARQLGKTEIVRELLPNKLAARFIEAQLNAEYFLKHGTLPPGNLEF